LVRRIKHSYLLREDWDILIILDACRYDTFKKILPNICKMGKLYRGDSEASSTSKWLKLHWEYNNGGFNIDMIYVSGNPFVNSKGINIEGQKKFDGRHYFGDIIDAWDFAFNRKTGRIEPDIVNTTAIGAYYSNPNCRFIVHFMQPHSPYIFDRKKPEPMTILRKLLPKKVISMMRDMLPEKVKQTNVHLTEHNYRRIYSEDEIKTAYEKNLKSVEGYVLELIQQYGDKKIVITSDHAEYLGEDGKYGHGGERTELITTVPILIINGEI